LRRNPLHHRNGLPRTHHLRLLDKRVTPDFFGVNVHGLEGFDPQGIPVFPTVGAGMP